MPSPMTNRKQTTLNAKSDFLNPNVNYNSSRNVRPHKQHFLRKKPAKVHDQELEAVEHFLRSKNAEVISHLPSWEGRAIQSEKKRSICSKTGAEEDKFCSGLVNGCSEKIVDSLLMRAKSQLNENKRGRKKKVRFLTQFTDMRSNENRVQQERKSIRNNKQVTGKQARKLKSITNQSRFKLNYVPEYRLNYLKNSVNSEYLTDRFSCKNE